MLKELRALLVAGQNTQALKLAEQLITEQPNNVDALHLAGISFARVGDADRASMMFEQALMIAPEDPTLHMNLAQLHLARGDLARAKDGYKAASMLDPNLSMAHSSLGNLAAIGGDSAGADELFLTALRADPNALPALLGRGHLLLDRGDVTAALPIAQQAAKLAQDDARAQALFGRALSNAGHSAFAIQAFDNAIRLKPGFFAARVMLARELIKHGEYPKAEHQLDHAADRAPKDATLKLVRADLYAKTGRSSQAAADLDDILSVMPNNSSALRARVGLHFSQGETEAGLQLLERSCIGNPREWLLNHAYIGYLLEFGRSAEARAATLAWTARAPDFAPAWMHLASLDEGQGDYDNAREFAEKAYALDPALPQVVLILARARLRSGHPGEAQQLLSAMLAKPCSQDQRIDALSLRGRALDALGQRNEAVTSWQEAAAERPSTLTLPALNPANAGPKRNAIASLNINADPIMPALIFLTGLPMSGVESVAWWLAHAPQAMVFNDRFGRRVDLQRQDFLNSVSDDRLELEFHASDLEHVRSRYLKALRRIAPQSPLKLIVDWLPVIDVRQYRVLRQALPEARWLHVERDSKDALLGALMSSSQLLPLHSLQEAAQRVKEHQLHLSACAKEHEANDFVFTFDQAKTEQPRLTQWLTQLPGGTVPPAERWAKAVISLGGLPAHFPAKRWQAFEAPLAAAFAAL
jgi:tetratricopeptide (TPR) repeat protein